MLMPLMDKLPAPTKDYAQRILDQAKQKLGIQGDQPVRIQEDERAATETVPSIGAVNQGRAIDKGNP
jgi:hypothetical protein